MAQTLETAQNWIREGRGQCRRKSQTRAVGLAEVVHETCSSSRSSIVHENETLMCCRRQLVIASRQRQLGRDLAQRLALSQADARTYRVPASSCIGLDKDTTSDGRRQNASTDGLVRQLQARTVNATYRTLVRNVEAGLGGTDRADRSQQTKMAVVQNGEARTYFQVVKRFIGAPGPNVRWKAFTHQDSRCYLGEHSGTGQ